MELTLDQALQKGIEAHEAGKVQEADQYYTAILKANPKHPDANHNMGVLAVGVGKIEAALPFFKTALEVNSSIAQYWLSYIDALIKLGELADAKAILEQAKSNGAKGDGFDRLDKRLREAGEKPLEDGKADLEETPQLQNVLNSLKLDQAIKLATKKSKEGSPEEAKRIYQDILAKFPKNKKAIRGLKRLSDRSLGKTPSIQDPPQKEQKSLVKLYSQGQLEQVLERAKVLLQQFPNSIFLHNMCGVIYQKSGQFDFSIQAYTKAITIKPDYAEAYYNMGLALKAHGKLDEAIEAYNKALTIKYDYAEAYNDLGVALKSQGKMEEALTAFHKALNIKNDFCEARDNLILLLTEHSPKAKISHPIFDITNALKKIDLHFDNSKTISDDRIRKIILRMQKILSNSSLDIETNLSQIYRRNSFSLNCSRHMSIFNNYAIIPEYCFGCYKVQVEPNTVLELVKLYVIFDQLKLENNNHRKCSVELRPKISGFYKGFIYCSNLEEATLVSDQLDDLLKKHIGPTISSHIKRGCSEYSLTFPLYKEISKTGPQPMNYNEEWQHLEIQHDKKFASKPKNEINSTLSGVSLHDCQIIKNWFSYARGIRDESIGFLGENIEWNSVIYSQAMHRSKQYPYKKMSTIKGLP